MFRKKKISNRLGTYPSCDLLNNALRILLNNPEEYKHAIKEIKLAIEKAGGYFHEDVEKKLKERDWMEFQEFCKQRERMCFSYECICKICSFGPLSKNECFGTCMARPKESEQKVDQWSKEHPIVTNADKFKEVFGVGIDNFEYSNEWLNQEYKEPEVENEKS